MRYLKGLMLLVMVIVAVAYWMNSRPKQQIDLSGAVSTEFEATDARDFTLPNEAGQMVSLSSFRGKPILLNFWATWCPPCIEEMPAFLKLASWAKTELGIETIGVSVDKGWGPIQKLFKEKKNLWPSGKVPLTILLNPDAKVAEGYGSTKYPETYFIDRDFKIIRKFTGVQDWTSQEITKWLSEHSK